MAESEREDFWGCILTDKKKSISWNGPSEANDDIAKLDISHRLVVSQACLGIKAKEGVRNLVQATSLDASNNKITIAIASLRAVTAEVCPLQLTFSSPVSFELIEGSGPVHLSGNHIQALSSYEMSDSGSDESETEDVESVPMLVENSKLSSKRGVAPTPKGPPSKKGKFEGEDEESSDSSDEEDSDLDEEAEKPKETTTEKKEETKEEKKDEKPEEKVEEKEPDDSIEKEEKKPMTFADLIAANENDSDDEDFEESEGDSDESDSDEETDDEDMEDEDSDEEDESDSEEEEEAAAAPKKKPVQNGKMNGSPKKTPSADNKKTPVSAKTTPAANQTPVSAKTTPAANKTPKGKTTPAAKSAPTTPQAPTDIATIKQMLLKTPNLPRKQDKFKNYMKSRFKTDDETTITSMWDWVQKNKK